MTCPNNPTTINRFDAQTHIRLPEPRAEGLPISGPPAVVLGIRPGERIFCPVAFYGKEDQVPIRLLAVWDTGQQEPWYLASDLADSDHIETLYRWRMRRECANRDEKTGEILREGGDHHARHNVVPFVARSSCVRVGNGAVAFRIRLASGRDCA